MIRSMTGFGQGECVAAGWRCTVELRSVNGRGLDARLRLPPGLAHLDEPLKKRIRERCERGKIEGSILLAAEDPSRPLLAVNLPLLSSYRAVLEQMAEALGRPVEVSLGDLLANRELVQPLGWEEQGAEIEALVQAALEAALDRLLAMRETEGQALEATLRGHADALAHLADRVAPLTAELPALYGKRLRENLARLADGGPIPAEERILQEIVLYADRCDVTEELARLRTHLEHMRQLLSEGGAVGRRIEFLLQELNRETNTLGSKSSDAKVSAVVVEMKAEIEKLREQIQNIE